MSMTEERAGGLLHYEARNRCDEQPPVAVSQSAAAAPVWTQFSTKQRSVYLAVLFLVAAFNVFDKNIVSVLLEPIKNEFGVSDTMLGLLSGFSFALFYAMAGVPFARWTDRGNRRTVITLAITVWSVMTMLCGLAQTFVQLILTRVGVGAGESGAIPPAHSLLADYFPPQGRASAIAIFTAAGTAGYLLAFTLGGYVAAVYGWRQAFLLAGAPGLILAIVVRLTLSEPRLRRGFPGKVRGAESTSESLMTLRRKNSFLYAVAGCLLYTFVMNGALMFVPSFLVRVQNASLADVSVVYGGIAAAASVIGTLGGGWIADKWSRHDIRWLAWLPAGALAIAGPLLVLAFSLGSYWGFVALAFLALLLMWGGFPPILAATHAICGNTRRAMAIAIIYFSSNLFGSGLGPLVTGGISDALSSSHGVDGLRYALMIVVTVLVAAGYSFYLCGRSMMRDLEA